ncbi:hypothetical protein ACQEVC_41410 [Plantactinospora sp. CA-294935]|uniref:hypothetical protein n=1 Tax=Plantactinospora sp. CA-294935 TaxID=3240012 RepID=UPI003D9509CC
MSSSGRGEEPRYPYPLPRRVPPSPPAWSCCSPEPQRCGDVWRRSSSDLGGVGRWAVNVTFTSQCAGNLNAVYASNTVTNATGGLTNIAVTP